MRFLADESCDFAVVRALRTEGYDVLAVVETHRGVEDSFVLELARQEKRILLTEDKDFGQLVYASTWHEGGVILIRFPAGARTRLADAALQAVQKLATKLVGAFTVLEPGRTRTGRVPSSPD